MTDLLKLADPFPPSDIEWRIGQSGKKDDGFWAKVLAYVTNRAIMQRLDDVLGPQNWRNEYVVLSGENKGFLCGLSILCDDGPFSTPQWITKWDGAEQTDIESVKGGLSNAMKRAAVQWGIGRYLYDLEEGWAKCYASKQPGAQFAKTKDGIFYWTPPELPKWALPAPPEKGDTTRNGSPPVMGPTPTIVKFTGLSLVHEPNPSGKQYWKIAGDTTHYGDRLKALGFKQTKQSKTFYTETESVMEKLAALLAPAPGSLEEMPGVLSHLDHSDLGIAGFD